MRTIPMRAIPSLLLLALLSALSAYAHAQTSLLDRIQERGEIRIGTTGDYKPFTYLNPETGTYEGMDIDAAQLLGEALGVSVRFVPTTWSTLSDDTMGDRFDLAMSGITRTLDRQKILALTNPYVTIGKSALIRKSDRNRFRGLQDMDRPWVRIGVNRGGTNEAFVRANIRQAAIVMFENNLDVQPAVAAGDVDVMFTDNVEAVIYARQNPVLYAVSPGEPLTREDIGYMTVRGDQPFVNFLNLWLFQMEQKGTLDALRSKWIGEY
ncbi:MAG: transporter substrate-binding domain-containing protein [Gemmatimonadetes bacterium]|nr:transporter substrate-binding domain-containing protein [Gemmatimonadota bacterium]MYB60872.1 transporter substrate-binding domain-containing protein [Gemmatimonadota bacterium]